MKQLLLLCMALLLGVTMTTGGAVHAMEPVGCVDDSTAASAGHSQGDGDQNSPDSEKGFVHHHGTCHGHHVSDVHDDPALGQALAANDAQSLIEQYFQARGPTGPALRPPIA